MASCLFKVRVGRRDLLRGGVILSVLQNWAKSVRLRCCRTHYRRALTIMGNRAGEPDKSKARFDALACVIDNGQIRTLPKAGVVSLSPTQI